MCHCDNGPTQGEGIVVYDPAQSDRNVPGVVAFKVYREGVIGSTNEKDYFLFQYGNGAVRRFPTRANLDAALRRETWTELGPGPRAAVVWPGYAFVALALSYGAFSLLFAHKRRERPVERRLGLYVVASGLSVGFGTLAFLASPYLNWTLQAPGDPFVPAVFAISAFFFGIPTIIGLGMAEGVAVMGTLAAARFLARTRLPPRWTWLLAWAVAHGVLLRATVGTYLLYTNPYWRAHF